QGEGHFFFKRKRKKHLATIVEWFNHKYPNYIAEYHPGDRTSCGYCAIRILERTKKAEHCH
ncbi:MAG: hypothetical protein WBM86_03565, partial [Waterburya sp.]